MGRYPRGRCVAHRTVRFHALPAHMPPGPVEHAERAKVTRPSSRPQRATPLQGQTVGAQGLGSNSATPIAVSSARGKILCGAMSPPVSISLRHPVSATHGGPVTRMGGRAMMNRPGLVGAQVLDGACQGCGLDWPHRRSDGAT